MSIINLSEKQKAGRKLKQCLLLELLILKQLAVGHEEIRTLETMMEYEIAKL